VIAGIQTEQCVPDRLRDGLIASGATVESAANAVGFVDARMLRHLRSRARNTSRG